MDLKLRDCVSVVTGGASGIGRAISLMFATHGASVVIIDRDPAVVGLAAEIDQNHRCGVTPVVADVTDYSAMRSAAADFSRCDHLVCAAGTGSGRFGFPFWNLEPKDWQHVLNVNLMGTVNAAHAFAQSMVQARSGTMLFLSSVAGQTGSPTDPPYSAAKAGVINFAQCAAKDLAPYGVRVNAICPGMVKTPMNRSVWQAWKDQQSESEKLTYEEWAARKISQITPLNRWQEPEDVAAMAVFLASPVAKNITGQTINVDGGQVMHW